MLAYILPCSLHNTWCRRRDETRRYRYRYSRFNPRVFGLVKYSLPCLFGWLHSGDVMASTYLGPCATYLRNHGGKWDTKRLENKSKPDNQSDSLQISAIAQIIPCLLDLEDGEKRQRATFHFWSCFSDLWKLFVVAALASLEDFPGPTIQMLTEAYKCDASVIESWRQVPPDSAFIASHLPENVDDRLIMFGASYMLAKSPSLRYIDWVLAVKFDSTQYIPLKPLMEKHVSMFAKMDADPIVDIPDSKLILSCFLEREGRFRAIGVLAVNHSKINLLSLWNTFGNSELASAAATTNHITPEIQQVIATYGISDTAFRNGPSADVKEKPEAFSSDSEQKAWEDLCDIGARNEAAKMFPGARSFLEDSKEEAAEEQVMMMISV